MAETVSPKVAAYIERVTGSLQKLKATAVEQKETATEVIAAVGSAYGGAYINERYPDRKLAGADVDAVGAVLCGVGAAMTSGVTSLVLGGAATGLACSVASRWGAAKGQKDRATAAAASAAK